LERKTPFFGTRVWHHFVVDILNRILPWDGWGGRIMATVMATGNADMENAAVDELKSRPDANMVMIERTHARCRRARAKKKTRVERATAESIPLPDHSQDAVVSVNNIQLWSDRAVGLDGCVRVLVPGGALVVLLHTWAMPDAVPAEKWIAGLTAGLSAR